MRTLPETCATTNLEGDPILLEKGTEGYRLLGTGFEIDKYNELVGADEEIINIMTCASMFGWDIPAVTNYEEKL